MVVIAIQTISSLYAQQSAAAMPGGGKKHNAHKAGNQQRIYGNATYEILDTTSFYLYKRTRIVNITKGSLQPVTEYSFSVNADAPIQPLSIEVLKQAYPDNTEFHYLLDGHFQTNAALLQYDPFLKMYKLKYLFNKSIK